MRIVELPVPLDAKSDEITSVVEARVEHLHLVIVSRDTLKGYPGCTHWHFKKPGEKGTLEATWYPAERRFWFKVQSGREAAWIDSAIQAFTQMWPLPP